MAPEFVDVSGGGKLAKHPIRVHLPVLVAPATGDEKFNTIRAPLLAIGCCKLPDAYFDFDSTFVLPGAAESFQKFARFRTDLAHPETKQQPPASVFGHADNQGPEDYNSMLSAHRAAAVYAILTRDVELFDKVRNHSLNGVGKAWGDRADRKMLSLVVHPEDKAPYYTPPPDKKQRTKATQDAIKRFQQHLGQGPTGSLTPAQRKLLYKEYMDALCHYPVEDPEKGAPYVMDPKLDFLGGGKGNAKNGEYKGDFQGCGEFNPVMAFSKEEETLYKNPVNHKDRDQKNRRNRRVLIFLFRHGTVVDRKKFPCPDFGQQGFAQANACKERLWSDADRREKERLEGKRRWFEDQEDTFRCRFYHGIALKSPCEELKDKLWKLRMVTLDANGAPVPIPGRRYVVKMGDAKAAALIRGVSDDDGVIPVPIFDEKGDMTLFFDGFGANQTVKVAAPSAPATGEAGGDGAGGTKEGIKQPTQPGQKPATFTGDDEAWPDEDEFLTFTIAGGKLKPLIVTAPDELGIKQRLHNLGYGPPDPDGWSDDVRRTAVKAWQRVHKREQTGLMTADELDILRTEYGDNEVDPNANSEEDLAIDDDQDD